MRKLVVVCIVATSLMLSACQEVRNEQVAAGVGGILGGLLGAQVGSGSGQLAAVAAGALFGAYLGGNVGRNMDDNDRSRTRQVLEGNPTGEPSRWQNPDSGNRYDVTPTRTYKDGDRPCRDYTTEAWIDDQQETLRGTACREPDGTWRAI